MRRCSLSNRTNSAKTATNKYYEPIQQYVFMDPNLPYRHPIMMVCNRYYVSSKLETNVKAIDQRMCALVGLPCMSSTSPYHSLLLVIATTTRAATPSFSSPNCFGESGCTQGKQSAEEHCPAGACAALAQDVVYRTSHVLQEVG